jgi:hypothetical protein
MSASSEPPAQDHADKAVRAPSGRFMRSLHDSKNAYRRHESGDAVGRVSPLRAFCPWPSHGAHGVTRPAFKSR